MNIPKDCEKMTNLESLVQKSSYQVQVKYYCKINDKEKLSNTVLNACNELITKAKQNNNTHYLDTVEKWINEYKEDISPELYNNISQDEKSTKTVIEQDRFRKEINEFLECKYFPSEFWLKTNSSLIAKCEENVKKNILDAAVEYYINDKGANTSIDTSPIVSLSKYLDVDISVEQKKKMFAYNIGHSYDIKYNMQELIKELGLSNDNIKSHIIMLIGKDFFYYDNNLGVWDYETKNKIPEIIKSRRFTLSGSLLFHARNI